MEVVGGRGKKVRMGGEEVFVWSVEKETNKIKKPVDVRGVCV